MWPGWNCIAQNYLLGCGEQRGSLMHEGPMSDQLSLRLWAWLTRCPSNANVWPVSGSAVEQLPGGWDAAGGRRPARQSGDVPQEESVDNSFSLSQYSSRGEHCTWRHLSLQGTNQAGTELLAGGTDWSQVDSSGTPWGLESGGPILVSVPKKPTAACKLSSLRR